MNKLWLIIKREYLTRVKKRTFILTTLLTPLAFVVFIVAAGFIMSSGKEELKVLVKDENGFFAGRQSLATEGGIYFDIDNSGADIETLKKSYKEKGKDGVVYISRKDSTLWNDFQVQYFSEKKIGPSSMMVIRSTVSKEINKFKRTKSGIDEKTWQSFNTEVTVVPINLSKEEGEQRENILVATVISSIMGILIYMVIFIYGSMVMRSVMEEKTSRIVEVMISSVKPFQMMLGKIIGVGAVGLTQFAIWMAVIPLLSFVLGLIMGPQMTEMQSMPAAGGPSAAEMDEMMMSIQGLMSFNYTKIIFFFLLYFLGGYFLYAALFAAVGSAVGDDIAESQSLTLPISIPIILAFYIGIAVIENPNSSLATWSSMVPLFSPIVMPARLAFDPPMWQILLSLAILFASCIGIVWIAGRIYRVGILMYGKKVSLKELAKWMFYKM